MGLEEKHPDLIDTIREMISEKIEYRKSPLSITVIELCERVCKPYNEIRVELNKLRNMGLIKAINTVNHKAIKLIEYDKED